MKRYTDTDKWEDPYFHGLSQAGKLAYNYITEKCNGIGVWKGLWDLLEFSIGFKGDSEGLKRELKVSTVDNFDDSIRFIILSDEKILVVKFLAFQFPNGLVSRKPMVIGARNKFSESSKSVKEILVNIYGKEFFVDASKINNSVSDPIDALLLEASAISNDKVYSKKEKKEAVEKEDTPLERGVDIINKTFSESLDRVSILTAFKEYLAKRTKMKKVMTARGVKTALNKLKDLDAKMWVKCLNEAVDSSWLSVFPEKYTEGKGRKIEPVADTFKENSSNDISLDV